MKILTIGVPAYNIEKYISQCLDSVIHPDVEVLVINDGSTDDTEKIAMEYQKKYPDIFRVISKPNGGWGSGVNRAVSEARGKYFKNLDSDDWFDKKGFEILLDNMRSNDADAFISPAVTVDDGSGYTAQYQFPNGCTFNKVIPFADLCRDIDFIFRMHTVAFRTSMLQENHFRIDECYYTDHELVSYPFEFVNTVFVQKESVYMYRRGREGQSIGFPSFAKHMNDIKTVAENVVSWYERLHVGDDRRSFFRRLAVVILSQYYTQPLAIDDKISREQWLNTVREYRNSLKSSDLDELSGYGMFAKLMISRDFAYSPIVAALWRFSMGRGINIADKIWNFLRKI